MKSVFALILLLAFSFNSYAGYIEYKCPQHLEFSPLKKGALTKTYVEIESQNDKKLKVLRVYEESVTSGKRNLVFNEIVRFSSEDVMNDYRNSKAFMRVYADELDQSYIQIKSLGLKVHVDCSSKR